MATTPSAPIDVLATDASERLPDCIIASSNRFDDLLPFCNSIYHAEPQKWGCILPWEFPQSAAREVEEDFLRKYFSETDIHMQGGAHGNGAGFRFLKQAWYSIALWNYEYRIPAIATWWLESQENSTILEDSTMRDALCNDEVKPETCFDSREIKMYGRPLLACVVKQIQDRVRAMQTLPVREAQTTEKPRSSSDGNMALDAAKTESVPVASPQTASNGRDIGNSSGKKPPRAASAIVSTNEVTTPFPIYEENPRSTQHIRHGDHGYTAYNAGYPNHQVQGRKRGGRLSSAGGGSRGAGYDRGVQDYQHRFNPGMFPPNGALADGSASFGAPVPGPVIHPSQVTATYVNTGPPIPGVLQAPTYDPFATRTPVQHARHPNFPSGEHHAQSLATPGMFLGGPTNHVAHRSDMERFSSAMPAHSGFNNVSAMSGDVRRSSFGSRGAGGLRGSNQLRGGKRGGRGRDYSHQASSVFEEGSYARKVSHESHQKSNSNYGKRRGSAYNENTWRSGSEHPQVENTLPQRVLSGPSEYVYQGYPSIAGSNLLPPFTFPLNQVGDRQGQAEHHPAPARLAPQQNVVPDHDVDERYIGSHATHVNELVVFNVPIQSTEDEVARDLSRTCDVEVVRVHFGRDVHGPELKLAFVQFPNHNVARRVLDLREVYLYDRPLSVMVPRKWFHPPPMPFILGQHGHELNASGSSFVPAAQFPPGSYGYPRDSAPPPQFGLPAMATNIHTHTSGTPRPGPVSFPPTTPFGAVKGEPGLSTVLSSNATPANSEPNTPKKKKNKNRKKAATSHATIVENDASAPTSSTDMATVPATPSKNKSKKERLQDRAASSDVISAGEITSSNSVPAMKEPKVANDGETSKDSQVPFDPLAPASRVAAEAKHSCESSQVDENKSDVTPTVSPRSQAPKGSSKEVDPVLDNKGSQAVATGKEPDVLHSSSPASDKDRPAIVGRVSDSDHVDESFHTASASPPTDKQSQTKAVPTNNQTPPNTARTKKSTKLSDKRSTSSQVKKAVNDIDEHVRDDDVDEATRHDSTSTPHVSLPKASSVDPERTLTTPLPAPTPSKKQSDNVLGDSKPPHSNSKRSISGPSSARQVTINVEKSESRNETTERAKDLSLENSVSLAEEDKRADENRSQSLGAQSAASATSIPPTPMTAYHTAPNTPASLPPSSSKDSTEKPSGLAKTSAKKGPSQTESFSMFGKKQQKQKKPAKGKGTLKVKPLELVNASNPTSRKMSLNVSSTATSLPAGASSSTMKPVLTVKTETGSNVPALNDNRPETGIKSGEGVCSEDAVTATNGQDSPNKGGIRGFFGELFSRVKSPSVSSKDTSLEDVPPEDELVELKTTSATPQAMFNIDHIIQQGTFDDERLQGDRPKFTTDVDTEFNDANNPDTSGISVTGLGIVGSNSADTPKKRRKKKKSKSAKRDESQREGSPGAYGDGDNPESSATASARMDTTSGSFDVESDNNSDKSSVTMGRPTPPMSPVTMTPSKRRLIEQRTTDQHILSPPPARNQRVKKKPHSRAASSTTANPAQEAPATPSVAPSETELRQQNRILQVYQLAGSDDPGDSHNTVSPPGQFRLSNLVDDEGNNQQVILTLKCSVRLPNNGPRLNIYNLSNGSDDDVVLTLDRTNTTE